MRTKPNTLAVLTLALFVCAAAVAQDAPTPAERAKEAAEAAPEQGASATDELALAQSQLADKYARLEELMLKMASLEAATNPRRAALLTRAVSQSKERLTKTQLESVVTLLNQQQLKRAVDGQTAVQTDLKALLELLMSEDRSDRLKNEQARIKEYIKEVERLIRLQKGLEGQNRSGGDAERLAKDQAQLAGRTGDLAQKIKENEEEGAEQSEGADEEGSDEDKSPMNGEKPGDEKSGDEKPSDSKPGDSGQKPGDMKSGDAKSGDSKSGEKPGEEKPSDNGKPGDTPGDEQQPDKAKPEDAGQKPGEEPKPGENKSGDEGKPMEVSDSKSGSQESQSGKPQSGKPQSGEPQSGEPMPGQQGQPSGDSQQPPSGDQQAQDNPARQRIEQAQQKMQDARKKLEEAKRKESVEDQRQARAELEKAKAELEEILRQMREEEVKRTLAALEQRFKKMLEMQLKVYESTRRLDQLGAENRGDAFVVEAGKLAFDERKIATEAFKALTLLQEEGSSVAFPASVEQMHEDMQQVAERLGAAKVDDITIGIEEDIVAALEEMIDALQKAQQDLENQQQQQQQQQGGEQEQPLVDQIAELKMIKALQLRVNKRTTRYARLLEDEEDLVGQARSADLVDALQKLSQRQQDIFQITRDIVLGKNE